MVAKARLIERALRDELKCLKCAVIEEHSNQLDIEDTNEELLGG